MRVVRHYDEHVLAQLRLSILWHVRKASWALFGMATTLGSDPEDYGAGQRLQERIESNPRTSLIPTGLHDVVPEFAVAVFDELIGLRSRPLIFQRVSIRVAPEHINYADPRPGLIAFLKLVTDHLRRFGAQALITIGVEFVSHTDSEEDAVLDYAVHTLLWTKPGPHAERWLRQVAEAISWMGCGYLIEGGSSRDDPSLAAWLAEFAKLVCARPEQLIYERVEVGALSEVYRSHIDWGHGRPILEALSQLSVSDLLLGVGGGEELARRVLEHHASGAAPQSGRRILNS